MNSAFQSTAILGSPSGWDAPPSPIGERVQLAAGGAFAALAVGFAVVAAFVPGERQVVWIALACAVLAWMLLRAAAGAEYRRVSDEGLIDAPSGLYNGRGLSVMGAALLGQCRGEGRPLGLVVLDFSDLPEVTEIYGREISRKVQGHLVRRMKALAGARGICARTGRTEFTVLLPGASRDKALAAVQRVLGKPSRIEFDAGDSEIVLVPELLCESAAGDLDSVDELYREVATELARIQAFEQRRQVWLTKERERHSRPMSLPPSTL